ncbi:MAG TPA: putative DNA modification/repair radical SAM protein [Oligoflexia bacterium]|nr:putative DNA modification/repair radical SAM protein [Oligoflexia bacterium]HMR24481.1 putative DNA modification/repair radical SAM protein [Oligoflexia bacterium]
MDHNKIKKKLKILADAAKYDASCASSGSNRPKKQDSASIGNTQGMGICHSYTPDGRCISLLKILMTNYCIYDCKFCINRVSSNVQRARFSPQEVVELTLSFYKRNYIEGLFLSSGIIRSSNYTMECLLEIVKSLRTKHHFNGYIHLKVIPEASQALIQQAGLYADRLSANIELPSKQDIKLLAPEKNITTLKQQISGIRDHITESKHDYKTKKKYKLPMFAPGGQSTQMIVGATQSNDRSILKTSSSMYKNYKMRRVYYSAFSPIPDAHSLLKLKKPPLIREHRLYQADWLLRFYGFDVDEIVPENIPDLDLDLDPKTAWALNHRDIFPIDINKADKELLLRIPGIGLRSVQKIMLIRKHHQLRHDDLKKLGLAYNRAKHFVKTYDHSKFILLDHEHLKHHLSTDSKQLELW